MPEFFDINLQGNDWAARTLTNDQGTVFEFTSEDLNVSFPAPDFTIMSYLDDLTKADRLKLDCTVVQAWIHDLMSDASFEYAIQEVPLPTEYDQPCLCLEDDLPF